MPAFTSPSRRRGLTLVEIMVATAVGAITLLATVAVVNATRALQEGAERRLTSYQSLNMALFSMTRYLENAGYRFPGQAVIIRNNIEEGVSLRMGAGQESVLRVLREGAREAGVLSGTDVIEVLVGDRNRGVGMVLSARSSGSDVIVTFENNEAPMFPSEVERLKAQTAQGPFIVFSGDIAGKLVSCTGLMTGMVKDAEFKVSLQDVDGQPARVPNCPQSGMSVFGLGSRRRFMAYQKEESSDKLEERVGLYVQSSLRNAKGFQNAGILDNPKLLAQGVEDLQLAASMDNTDNLFGCGGSPTCQCGRGDMKCTRDFLQHMDLLRGVRIRLLSRGIHSRWLPGTPRAQPNPSFVLDAGRPPSFDREEAKLRDNVLRQSMEGFVDFPNLNPYGITSR